MKLDEQSGRAGDVRSRHRRPVEDGEARLSHPRQRRREDLSARRGDVGLQRVPERCRPARREARDDPATGGDVLQRVASDLDRRPAARPGHEGAQELAVEIGDHPGRNRELERDRVRLALSIVGEDEACGAGGLRLERLRHERAEPALGERDRTGERVARQLSARRRRVGRRAAKVPVDGPVVDADDRPDVDELLVEDAPAVRGEHPGGAEERNLLERVGCARRRNGQRGREDVPARDGRDRDRVGRGAGRAGGAETELIAVVAGGDHRHDARGHGVADGLDHGVVGRVALGAAPGEVDHVHPVRDRRLERGDDLGRVRDVPDRRRHREDAIVAEPRAGRDARQAARLGMIGSGRRRRAGVPGGDPGDMRAVEGRARIDGKAPGRTRIRTGKDARHDHLGRCPAQPAAREAGRVLEARRVEERVRLVDAVVDDGDLDAFAARPRDAVQLVRADHGRAPVERLAVADAGVDARDDVEAHELRQALCGQRHREAVDEDAEAAADARLRDRASQRHACARLRGIESAQVGVGGCAVDVQPAGAVGGGDPSPERCGERRQAEARDHTHASPRLAGRDVDHACAYARLRELAGPATDRLERRRCGHRGCKRRADGGEGKRATHRTISLADGQ